MDNGKGPTMDKRKLKTIKAASRELHKDMKRGGRHGSKNHYKRHAKHKGAGKEQDR